MGNLRRIARKALGVVRTHVPLAFQDSFTAFDGDVRRFAELPTLRRIIEEVRPYTMVPTPGLRALAGQVAEVVKNGIEGDLVECGVWRGGSSFLMARVLDALDDKHRRVWLLDSFAGLPEPREIDGPAALNYANKKEAADFFDNCCAERDEVKKTAAKLGLAGRVKIIGGWFEETLPRKRDEIGKIALLRIDADWYDSVLCCLENLYDLVTSGGLVVVDDYYTWDGCTKAVHEFLASRALSDRIDRNYCGYIRKSPLRSSVHR